MIIHHKNGFQKGSSSKVSKQLKRYLKNAFLEKAKTTEISKEEGLNEIEPLTEIDKFKPIFVKYANRNNRPKG